jgi:hypothetical protein
MRRRLRALPRTSIARQTACQCVSKGRRVRRNRQNGLQLIFDGDVRPHRISDDGHTHATTDSPVTPLSTPVERREEVIRVFTRDSRLKISDDHVFAAA